MKRTMRGVLAHPAARRALAAAVWAALWLWLLRFPEYLVDASLDSSWLGALGYFSAHGFQFGKDIVFTYGPLGFLVSDVYSGYLFWTRVCWELAFKAVFALLLIDAAGRLSGRRSRILFLAAAAYFSALSPDLVYSFAIVSVGARMLRPGKRRRFELAGGSALLAALALSKFTMSLLAFAVVGIVVVGHTFRRSRGTAAAIAVSFGAAFLAIWAAAGQSPGNIPDYFRWSFEVGRHYSDGMSLAASWMLLPLGLAVAALLGVLGAKLAAAPGRRDRLLALAVYVPALALAWRHSFIRSVPLQVYSFFALSALTAFSMTAFVRGPSGAKRAGGSLAAAVVVLCVLGTWIGGSAVTGRFLREGARRAARNLRTVFSLRRFSEFQGLRLALRRQKYALPKIRERVGDASLDVFGYGQGAALLNGFRYQPRPVFQSPCAYSPALTALNAAHYAGPDAPRFVLYRAETIDARLPGSDDGAALRVLLRRYRPVLDEGSFVLLERNDEPAGPPARRRVANSRRFGFGEKVFVPACGDCLQWAVIRLQPSLLGRLVSLVYKSPVVRIGVWEDGEPERTFRLVPGLAASGLLLNPYLETERDLWAAHGQGRRRRITAFAVSLPPGAAALFADSFEVILHQDVPPVS